MVDDPRKPDGLLRNPFFLNKLRDEMRERTRATTSEPLPDEIAALLEKLGDAPSEK